MGIEDQENQLRLAVPASTFTVNLRAVLSHETDEEKREPYNPLLQYGEHVYFTCMLACLSRPVTLTRSLFDKGYEVQRTFYREQLDRMEQIPVPFVPAIEAAGREDGAGRRRMLFGGSRDDGFNSITAITDGSFLCAGYSISQDIPGTVNHGIVDACMLRLSGSLPAGPTNSQEAVNSVTGKTPLQKKTA